MRTTTTCFLVALLAKQAGFAASEPTSTRVLERGPHHKVVEIIETSEHYTVLGSGMHVQDASGNWGDSSPAFIAYADGIAGTGAAHRLILDHNLNTAGPVDYQSRQGDRIVSRPLAIYYHDPETGQTVTLGTLQDCAAELVEDNRVVYLDCFSGDIGRVAVSFRYTRYGIHQDVIFLSQPPPPSAYGLGERTEIQVATELLDFPEPEKTVHRAERKMERSGEMKRFPSVQPG